MCLQKLKSLPLRKDLLIWFAPLWMRNKSKRALKVSCSFKQGQGQWHWSWVRTLCIRCTPNVLPISKENICFAHLIIKRVLFVLNKQHYVPSKSITSTSSTCKDGLIMLARVYVAFFTDLKISIIILGQHWLHMCAKYQ